MANETKSIRCACGEVVAEVLGPPIVSATCYCGDCQEAGERLEALPGGRTVRDPDGGTPLVLQNKRRFRVVQGAEKLEGHKLREGTPTSRFVATCCGTPMYLGFDQDLHWVSIFRHRFGDDAPPVEMRLNTKSMAGFRAPQDGIPTHAGVPFSFVGRLVLDRLMMAFRR